MFRADGSIVHRDRMTVSKYRSHPQHMYYHVVNSTLDISGGSSIRKNLEVEFQRGTRVTSWSVCTKASRS